MDKKFTVLIFALAIPMSSCSTAYEQATKLLNQNNKKETIHPENKSTTEPKQKDTVNGEHNCRLGGTMLIENFKGIQSSPTVIYRGERYSMSPYTHPTQNFLNFVDSNLSGAELSIGSSVYFVIKSASGETVESCSSTGLTSSQSTSQKATYPITCFTRTIDGTPIKEYSMLNPPLIKEDSLPMTDGSAVAVHHFSYGTEIGEEVYGLQKPYGANSAGTWLPAKDLRREDGELCNSGFKIVRR